MKRYKKFPSDDEITYRVADSAMAYGLISQAREGLPFDFFVGLVKKLPLSFREWASVLHLSERTLQRYQKDNKSFEAAQSERLIELSMLNNKGIDLFGSEDRWHVWLSTPSVALGNVSPKSLLDSTIGTNLLRDELSRIEQGVFA